ncbi:zinc-binding dehydrogenase [Pseudophaeobacter flagellatus]|uniref:zinc-binding dehydrogenase n=1 Tax=Pseudophaeobacter flagellatus TaxID=2899119 RepID=UPI001E5FBC81|nr:zinc-binding dehydrogenase [Pseudophaeobacter flagellatus]MCD9146524.1 zinc-binding dehydrogenase [Pseudophaeobacter flagellatus]
MIPETMRAMLLTGHGGPDKLVLDDHHPVPTITPEEVLIKVGACGINNTDIWVREGAYGSSDDPEEVTSFGDDPLRFPLIQGADIVGTIAACGDAIDPSRLGERVMVDFGIYSGEGADIASHDYIGSYRPGGFAEYVAVPAVNAHQIETELSDAEMATFCCAYVTGEHMLRRARVCEGERVLVTGASGGVGSGVVQLCRARGAIPYGVVGTGKEDLVRSIGAEEVVERGCKDMVAAVKAATGGAVIDVIVDTVAGPMMPDLIEVLRPGGRYATCGAMGGPIVELDMRRIYLKNIEIHGASQGARRDFVAIRDYALSDAIKPLLAGVFPLAELACAQEKFARKDFVGKLVVTVNS